jgi:hypothetical protein
MYTLPAPPRVEGLTDIRVHVQDAFPHWIYSNKYPAPSRHKRITAELRATLTASNRRVTIGKFESVKQDRQLAEDPGLDIAVAISIHHRFRHKGMARFLYTCVGLICSGFFKDKYISRVRSQWVAPSEKFCEQYYDFMTECFFNKDFSHFGWELNYSFTNSLATSTSHCFKTEDVCPIDKVKAFIASSFTGKMFAELFPNLPDRKVQLETTHLKIGSYVKSVYRVYNNNHPPSRVDKKKRNRTKISE